MAQVAPLIWMFAPVSCSCMNCPKFNQYWKSRELVSFFPLAARIVVKAMRHKDYTVPGNTATEAAKLT